MFKRNVGSKQKILQVDIAKDRQGHKIYLYSEIKETPTRESPSSTVRQRSCLVRKDLLLVRLNKYTHS